MCYNKRMINNDIVQLKKYMEPSDIMLNNIKTWPDSWVRLLNENKKLIDLYKKEE